MNTDSPPRTPTWPPEQARRLDRLCDRFEASWRRPARSGPRRRSSTRWARPPTRTASALLPELIGLDVYYRRQRGEDPGPEEYRRRFPDLDSRSLARAFARRPDPDRPAPARATRGPGGPALPGSIGSNCWNRSGPVGSAPSGGPGTPGSGGPWP